MSTTCPIQDPEHPYLHAESCPCEQCVEDRRLATHARYWVRRWADEDDDLSSGDEERES